MQDRRDKAYFVAAPLLAAEFAKHATLPVGKVREIAARGLIEAGIGDRPEDDIAAVLTDFQRGIEMPDGRSPSVIIAGQQPPPRRRSSRSKWRSPSPGRPGGADMLTAEIGAAGSGKSYRLAAIHHSLNRILHVLLAEFFVQVRHRQRSAPGIARTAGCRHTNRTGDSAASDRARFAACAINVCEFRMRVDQVRAFALAGSEFFSLGGEFLTRRESRREQQCERKSSDRNKATIHFLQSLRTARILAQAGEFVIAKSVYERVTIFCGVG